MIQKNWFFCLCKNQRFADKSELVGFVCNAEPNDNEILLDSLDEVREKTTNELTKKQEKLVICYMRTKIRTFYT